MQPAAIATSPPASSSVTHFKKSWLRRTQELAVGSETAAARIDQMQTRDDFITAALQAGAAHCDSFRVDHSHHVRDQDNAISLSIPRFPKYSSYGLHQQICPRQISVDSSDVTDAMAADSSPWNSFSSAHRSTPAMTPSGSCSSPFSFLHSPPSTIDINKPPSSPDHSQGSMLVPPTPSSAASAPSLDNSYSLRFRQSYSDSLPSKPLSMPPSDFTLESHTSSFSQGMPALVPYSLPRAHPLSADLHSRAPKPNRLSPLLRMPSPLPPCAPTLPPCGSPLPSCSTPDQDLPRALSIGHDSHLSATISRRNFDPESSPSAESCPVNGERALWPLSFGLKARGLRMDRSDSMGSHTLRKPRSNFDSPVFAAIVGSSVERSRSSGRDKEGSLIGKKRAEEEAEEEEDDEDEEELEGDKQGLIDEECNDGSEGERSGRAAGVPKACLHCGTSRTPLWRNGPPGPKSLCNACGIRFNKIRAGKRKPTAREAAMLQKYDKGGSALAPSSPTPSNTLCQHNQHKIRTKAARQHSPAPRSRPQPPGKAVRVGGEEEQMDRLERVRAAGYDPAGHASKRARVAASHGSPAPAGKEGCGAAAVLAERHASGIQEQQPGARDRDTQEHLRGARLRAAAEWDCSGAAGGMRGCGGSSRQEGFYGEDLAVLEVSKKLARQGQGLYDDEDESSEQESCLSEPLQEGAPGTPSSSKVCAVATSPLEKGEEDIVEEERGMESGSECEESDVEIGARLLMEIFHGHAAVCC